MTAIAQVGAQIYLGYAVEASAGTAHAPTDYVPVEPDGVTLNFDPKREPLEVALGTLMMDQYLTELEGAVTGDVTFPLFSRLGQKLLFNAGLQDTVSGTGAPYTHTGALVLPKSVTIEVGQNGQAIQYAGCYAKSVKIEHSSKNGSKVTIGYDGLVRPAILASPSTPAITGDLPYIWSHVQPVTLVATGAGVQDVDSIELSWTFENQLWYGSNADNMPFKIIPGPCRFTGKFSKLFESFAEYTSFNTAGQTPQPMAFNWINGTKAFSVLVTSAFYPKGDIKRPLKGAITEEYDFQGLAVSGASPISVIALNSDSAAYN